MMNVPYGKLPSCIPTFSWNGKGPPSWPTTTLSSLGNDWSSRIFGTNTICFKLACTSSENVSHVLRLRASKPHPEYPSFLRISTNIPLPQPMSTNPENSGFGISASGAEFCGSSFLANSEEHSDFH